MGRLFAEGTSGVRFRWKLPTLVPTFRHPISVSGLQMSIPFPDTAVHEAARLISSDRLATFVAITGTERDGVELHRLSMTLNGSISPALGMIEIALRNSICERLRSTFGTADWLINPPEPFAWHGEERDAIKRAIGQARRAVYTKRSSSEKKELDILAFPQECRQASHTTDDQKLDRERSTRLWVR